MKTQNFISLVICFCIILFISNSIATPRFSPEQLSVIISDRTKSVDLRISAVVETENRKLSECIPVLISEIDIILKEDAQNEILPLEVNYPCVKALIAIGAPSVSPVMNALNLPQSKLRQLLFRDVLVGIEGEVGASKVKKIMDELNARQSTTAADQFPASKAAPLQIPNTVPLRSQEFLDRPLWPWWVGGILLVLALLATLKKRK